MTGTASSREHEISLGECMWTQLESTNETFVPDGTTQQRCIHALFEHQVDLFSVLHSK